MGGNRTDDLQVTGSDQGATMIEYALMVMLIALAALASVTAFGVGVNGLFTSISGI